MTIAQPTTENPLAPTPRRTNDGVAMCWKRTQTVWATVPAPWGDGVAGDWFVKQPRRLVFSSRPGDYDPYTPTLDVYAVGDMQPSDARAYLVCVVMGGEVNPTFYNRDDCDMIFLCDWPALPRLIAEYSPMLKFHEASQP